MATFWRIDERRRERAGRPIDPAGWLPWLLLVATLPARADRVEVADGRTLEGRFANLPGVALDPLEAERQGASLGQSILMCDDELARVMVPRRQVRQVESAVVDPGMERIRIPQRIPEGGRRVAGIGAILGATPFDEYGRRVLTLATATGRLDVVQGITEITPRWTRVQGIQTEKPLVLDMRLATSSIPRDVLGRVISQHIDRTSAAERLAVVRLLLQADRFEDAKAELDEVLADVPDLADIAGERRAIARLAASRLLEEIRLRSGAGQDRLALRLLEQFPADDAGGELLEAVREARDAYTGRRDHAARLVAMVRDRLATLDEGPLRDGAAAVVDEIARERLAGLRGLLEELVRTSVTIEANANDEGHLYGSVVAADIARSLKQQDLMVSPDCIVLQGPLKEVGLYTVKVRLAAEVEGDLKVWVVPSSSEAGSK